MTDAGQAAGWPMPDPNCPTCRGAGFVAVEPPPGAAFADGPCPACDGPEKRAARRAYAETLKSQAAEVDTQALAEAFCAWPLPETVCPDRCAWPIIGQPSVPRSGTNLLTVAEAKAMFEHLIKSGLLSNRTRSPSVSDDLRRLREAATPGTWEPQPFHNDEDGVAIVSPGHGLCAWVPLMPTELPFEGRPANPRRAEANAAFMAAAANDVSARLTQPAPEATPAEAVRVEPEATSSKFDATWRPMSSAPRDGTSVLLSCGGATGLGSGLNQHQNAMTAVSAMAEA